MSAVPIRSRFTGMMLLLAVALSACGGGLLSEREEIADACRGIDLPNFANTRSEVRLTNDGPIVAREDHVSVLFVVDASYRHFQVLEGYGEPEQPSRRFDNDIDSYEEFLSALEFEGFTRCRDVPAGLDPEGVGVCPQDRRIVVELWSEGEQILRLWWADCGRNRGTLAGNPRTILELFEAQIPGYERLVEQLDL